MNQLRQKIGIVFGNPETTTGGNALKFYASVRLDIRKIGVVKNGEEVVGSKTKVKVAKNKVAPPFKEALFDIMYGMGVNYGGELVDLASDAGLVEKSGAYYSWKGERIAQGRDNAARWFVENPAAAEELRSLVLAHRKAADAAVFTSPMAQGAPMDEAAAA